MALSETTAKPDLSSLPRDVRVRIAVAETQGATWEWIPGQGYAWQLTLDAWQHMHVYVPKQDRYRRDKPLPPVAFGRKGFPDYLSDPAAWGGLVQTERVLLQPAPDSTVWYATTHGDGLWHDGDTPGEAVCAAVLAKHDARVW